MEGAHVIDVNELVISMTRKQQLERLGGEIHGLETECPLICRIGQHLRDTDKEVYEPNVLPIGPYHHKTASNPEIERMKWVSLGNLLKLNSKKRIRDYIEGMEGLEPKIRSYYSNAIPLNSHELLRLMLLDGCCLLFVLRGMEGIIRSTDFGISNLDETNVHLEQDMINSNELIEWYTGVFSFDLLLVENQIPFFVVAKIYDLFTDGKIPTSLLVENIADSIEALIYNYPKPFSNFERPKEFHHLLHLCHMYFKPNQPLMINSNQDDIKPRASNSIHFDEEDYSYSEQHSWHRAVEYQRAGIKIKKKEFYIENPHSLLDIGFCDGLMEMPCLTIDPNTYCLFRNLVAFEQTCPKIGNYMTAYVVFLSQFISTPDDVSLLAAKGIILHQLDSDDEVCHLFRLLSTGVAFDFNCDHCLKPLCSAIEMHYEIHKPKWREWIGAVASKVPWWSGEDKLDEAPESHSPELA